MEAYFGLIHLQQLLKQLALREDSLRMARNTIHVAEVFAIHGPEYEVAILLTIGQETERSEQLGEPLVGNDSARREHADHLVVWVQADYWRVRFRFHQVQNLPISEE